MKEEELKVKNEISNKCVCWVRIFVKVIIFCIVNKMIFKMLKRHIFYCRAKKMKYSIKLVSHERVLRLRVLVRFVQFLPTLLFKTFLKY